MLEDIQEIAELEPSGIIHIAVLFPFYKLYKFYLSGGVLLLGRQPLVQKRLFLGQTSKSIQIHFQKFQDVFPLSVLFCKERPMFIFDICI